MIDNVQTFDVQVPHEIVEYWGWFLAFGICLLLLVRRRGHSTLSDGNNRLDAVLWLVAGTGVRC
jgi:hypothetical protein